MPALSQHACIATSRLRSRTTPALLAGWQVLMIAPMVNPWTLDFARRGCRSPGTTGRWWAGGRVEWAGRVGGWVGRQLAEMASEPWPDWTAPGPHSAWSCPLVHACTGPRSACRHGGSAG